MRKIIFKGKTIDSKEWIYGDLTHVGNNECAINGTKVSPESVGQFTGLTDAFGTDVYEGDLIQYFSARYKDRDHLINVLKRQVDVVEWSYYTPGYVISHDNEFLFAYGYDDGYVWDDVEDMLEQLDFPEGQEEETIKQYKEQFNCSEKELFCWKVIGNVFDNPELVTIPI